MHKEIKDEWITRLRSGEYEQGLGTLNNHGEFCCWGVLCEMAYEAGAVQKTNDPGNPLVKYNGLYGMPPNEVYKWAGIPYQSVAADDKIHNLANLNDAGKPFNKIADIIEEQF